MEPLNLRPVRKYWWLLALILFAAIGGGLVLARNLWLPLPAEWLVVRDRLAKSELLFIPSGNVVWRAPLVARLYRDGYAPRVLVTGGYYSDYFLLLTGETFTDAEMVARVLANLGVPREAMALVKGGTSTYEEALILRKYVDDHSVRSVIVVTSNFHSRRARWIFRKVLGGRQVGISMVEADHANFTTRNWWRHEDGLITVSNEYIKLVYYFLRY